MTPLVPLLLLVLAVAPPTEGEGPPPLDEEVRARIDDLDAVESPAEIDALYDLCQLRHGELAPLLAALEEREASDDPARAARAKRVAARLLWRQGDLRAAARRLDDVVEAAPTLADRVDRADLLDAAGRTSDAFEAYEALVDEVEDEATRESLLLRLALMELDRGDEDAARLEELARAPGRTDDDRRRAAVVLALSGRPGDAIALFPVGGDGKERFLAEMRVAEWAMKADDAARAREAAWRAARAATLGRDRRYALTVLVEAYRATDDLPALLERFAAADDLDEDARRVWIDLLRETGRVDEALSLFRSARGEAGFTAGMRRELLEMCREAGRTDELVREYERLIATEPAALEWREGLARHHLERGDVDAARALFAPLVDDPSFESLRLECAERARGLGLDDLARRFAERVIAAGSERGAEAFRFVFDLERTRGRLDAAAAALERFDAAVPEDAASRGALAESYEQLGRLDRAVEVLEALRTARGEERAGEDLEMRLAWLHSEVGDEETALERWHGLWRRVESVARRRYVEDRLMTVASRLGKLADVAIDLEERLYEGDATDRDAGLLVRLYTKANDPVSAAEVLEEFMKGEGSSEVAILQEKARIYLACTDYFGFEEVLRELIEVDPDHRVDHLRQLAMSQLERGEPAEAREVLARLRELEGGVEGAEFEAGVLALAGLRDEAVRAYRQGLAAHPDRIEAYLLLANVLREEGETRSAIGMFQYLAEHAEKDDLFTIAIDGLLNMEAPPPVLKWARRVTLERLASRHEKVYLYRLLADLSGELSERDAVLDALEAALPIAGERRATMLRELMDLAAGGRRGSGDRDRQLRYGRRLVGLAEVVPPQVYLELGAAFLENDEPIQASRTFSLATDVPDRDAFRAQVAGAFEEARYVEDALRVHERSLVARPTDVGLIAEVAELHERLGREDVARPMFSRALDLLLRRRPRSSAKADDDEGERSHWSGFSRNVDDWESHAARVLTGLLATTVPGPAVDALLERERARIDAELEAEREEDAALDEHPRLLESAAVHRRVALAFGRAPDADAVDLRLLRAFPEDEDLLERLVRERMTWGLVRSARALVDGSGREPDERRRVRVLTGAGGVDAAAGTLPLREVEGLVLPALVEGRRADAMSLLRRTDFSSVDEQSLGALETLFGAAAVLNDPDLMLTFGRQWIHGVVHHGPSGGRSWVVESVLDRCGRVLDDELEWTLAQSVVSLLLDERLKDEVKDVVQVLPSLQQKFERPLLEPEAVTDLLLDRFSGSPWGAGLMFEMIPEQDRTRVLRTVWPKVAKTQRARFVLNLVSELTGDVRESFADLLVESFGAALSETDDKGFLRYSVRSVVDGGEDRALARRILEAALENGLDHLSLRLSRVVLLARSAGAEEALPAALEALRDALDEVGSDEWDDWDTRRALGRVYAAFLPAHADEVLGVIDEAADASGPSPALVQVRLDVMGALGDDEAAVAALRAAVLEHEDDEDLRRRLEATLRRAGREAAALEVLEAVVESEDDARQQERDRNRLVRGWKTLRHPERALAALEEADEDEERDAEEEAAARERKLPPATIDALKEAVDAGELDAARGVFHRLWRGESSGRPTVRYLVVGGVLQRMGGGYVPTYWPEDEEEDGDDREPEWSRGGLPEWVDAPPESEGEDDEAAEEERTRTIDVLVGYEFGREETWRRLRTLDGPQLANETATFDALAAEMARREGRAAASRRLLGRIESGAGGLVEHAMVLALVAQDPASVGDDERTMLADVLRTVRPDDLSALRRLARVFARTGDVETATRLFRWCATRTDDNSFGSSGARISPRVLIEDVRESLDGAARLAVIEAILAWAEPGDMAWRRASYEDLVLATWEELLGPAGALERGRAICEGVLAPPDEEASGWRRGTAKHAARLFACAGELDAAVRALEVAAARMDEEDDEPSFSFLAGGGITFDTEQGMGRLGSGDLQRLFPASAADFRDEETRVAWLGRAGAALAEWAAAGRLRRATAVHALVIVATRLGEAGEVEAARARLDAAEEAARDAADLLLWVADARRRVGQDPRADAIERALLDRGVLNPERAPDVVARVLEVDGAAAAARFGEEALDRTRHPRLLEVMMDAARAAGDEDALERLAGLERSRSEAERALEARLEAKRKERR